MLEENEHIDHDDKTLRKNKTFIMYREDSFIVYNEYLTTFLNHEVLWRLILIYTFNGNDSDNMAHITGQNPQTSSLFPAALTIYWHSICEVNDIFKCRYLTPRSHLHEKARPIGAM